MIKGGKLRMKTHHHKTHRWQFEIEPQRIWKKRKSLEWDRMSANKMPCWDPVKQHWTNELLLDLLLNLMRWEDGSSLHTVTACFLVGGRRGHRFRKVLPPTHMALANDSTCGCRGSGLYKEETGRLCNWRGQCATSHKM